MRNNWYKLLAIALCALMLVTVAPTAAQTAAEDAEQHLDEALPEAEPRDDAEPHDWEEQPTDALLFWDEPEGKASKATGAKGKETHSDEPLLLGENTIVTTEPYEEVYRPFTPQEDGFYVFFSVSEFDTIGFLYASNDPESAVAEDDDTGTEYNFSFHAKLTAGETYYLRTYFYDKKSGSFSVMIKQLPENACGDNLTWTFDGASGLLTIEGDGQMWELSEMPWHSLLEEIRSVSLPDGLERITEGAFRGCVKLQAVVIPDSVKDIDSYAFYGCSALTSAAIPNGVWNIAGYCFYNCGALESVTLPISLHSVYEHAFTGCTALSTVYYRGTQEQRTRLISYIATGNDLLTNADWQYLGEPCPHVNSWEAETYSDHRYTDLQDDIWHRHSYTATPYSYCSDCRQRFDYGTPEQRSELERHWYDKDDGVCEDCGHVNQCRHLRRESGYWWDDYTVQDVGSDKEHLMSGTYVYYETCLDCGVEIFYEQREGQMLEPHHYNEKDDDGVCYMCGHRNACTHPHGTEERIDWNKSVCYDADDTYHATSGEGYIEQYCPDCLMALEYRYERRYEQEEHEFDAYGYCRVCGHENDGLTTEGVIEWNAADVKFKGTTPYVIANGSAQTPRFTVKNKADGSVMDPKCYSFFYTQNVDAGTGYVFVSFKNGYAGYCRGTFKIYLPATTTTTVANIQAGVKLTWSKVAGADGYVIYRRAWSSTTNGWTDFVRWNNTTALEWTDTKVYAGTRYQYGVKAYFNKRTDPVTGATIGGNVGDNYNLGEVGPLKTTVRITTRTLNSLTAGTKQLTAKWSASGLFTGYQLQISVNSSFTQNATVTYKITNPKTSQKVITNLNSGTKYYVRIRSYHVFNGVTYYGGWSNVLSCRVK